MPAARASLASVAKRSAPAISPTSLAAVSGPKPGSASSCGATWATRSAISASSALIGLRSARAGGAARRGRSGRASSARRAPGAGRSCVRPLLREQRAAGQRQLGPEVVQVPLQRVVERDARADQPLAVIDQQPDVELRRRPAPPSAASRCPPPAPRARPRARRSDRTCRARGSSAGVAGHQPRRDAHDALAARDQEPLQARPRRAGSPPAPTPARRRGRAPRSPAPRTRGRRPRPSCRRAARRSPRRPRRSCASACACPPRARS